MVLGLRYISAVSHLIFIVPVIFLNNFNSAFLGSMQISSDHSFSLQPRFIGFPLNQTVFVGEIVKLLCIVANIRGELQWTKNGFGLGDLSAYPSYFMRGNKAKGDYSLMIYKVTPEDEGSFECQAMPGLDGLGALRSPPAFLTVEFDAMAPIIVQQSQLEVIDGETITLECHTSGKPLPEITWLDNLGQAFPNEAVVLTENVSFSRLENEEVEEYSYRNIYIKSLLSFKSSLKYDKQRITCQVRRRTQSSHRRDKVMKAFIQIHVKSKKKNLDDQIKSKFTSSIALQKVLIQNCKEETIFGNCTNNPTRRTEEVAASLELESRSNSSSEQCRTSEFKTHKNVSENVFIIAVSAGIGGFLVGTVVLTAFVIYILLRYRYQEEIYESAQPMLISHREFSFEDANDDAPLKFSSY